MSIARVVPLACLALAAVSCSSDTDESGTSTTQSVITTEVPWADHAADIDTEIVFGRWVTEGERQVGQGLEGVVETVLFEFIETLELSDPRASGATTYTAKLYIPEPTARTGGPWIVEEITITNDDGAWTGYAMGNYTYSENLPDGAASQDVVIFGEWHFVGSGAHDGLQLDFYSANDVGVIGTIRPIPEAS